MENGENVVAAHEHNVIIHMMSHHVEEHGKMRLQ